MLINSTGHKNMKGKNGTKLRLLINICQNPGFDGFSSGLLGIWTKNRLNAILPTVCPNFHSFKVKYARVKIAIKKEAIITAESVSCDVANIWNAFWYESAPLINEARFALNGENTIRSSNAMSMIKAPALFHSLAC